MESFKVLWTDTNGHRQVSVVSYDRPSAEARASELRASMSDVSIVPVFPPDWKLDAEQPLSRGRIVQRRHTASK
ncbi:hypothetical protein [Streptomyces sp. NPDC002088]|uniref:hypothetical protein n=1 Tax=Streptomyces sp. NPDC002088 TaxID=3154665 RepID=UPI00331E6B32